MVTSVSLIIAYAKYIMYICYSEKAMAPHSSRLLNIITFLCYCDTHFKLFTMLRIFLNL